MLILKFKFFDFERNQRSASVRCKLQPAIRWVDVPHSDEV